jgi:hypothetical protein
MKDGFTVLIKHNYFFSVVFVLTTSNLICNGLIENGGRKLHAFEIKFVSINILVHAILSWSQAVLCSACDTTL